MSHFYGTMQGSRGEATRCGTKTSGLTVTAASWKGAIKTVLFVDDKGRDCFRVEQMPWHNGDGIVETVATGVIGEHGSAPYWGPTHATAEKEDQS